MISPQQPGDIVPASWPKAAGRYGEGKMEETGKENVNNEGTISGDI